MITAQRNGKYITINASHFKRVDPSFFQNQEDKVDSNDDDLNSPTDQVTLPPVPPVAPLVPPAATTRSGRPRRIPQRLEPSWN